MIYTDSNGFPLNSTLDGGDSSMRCGIGTLVGIPWPKTFDIGKYEGWHGWLRRHPTQAPINTNVMNFTPDQAKPLLAGLNAAGRHEIIRRVAIMQFLRMVFLGQDLQKDVPGSWKVPWPHTYPQGQRESFDFATPILPNDWWCLIKGGHLYPLYILFPICLFFAVIAAWTAGSHQEQNQIISELSFYPKFMMRFYVWANLTTWKVNNTAYWESKGEIEYAQYIEKYVTARIA